MLASGDTFRLGVGDFIPEGSLFALESWVLEIFDLLFINLSSFGSLLKQTDHLFTLDHVVMTTAIPPLALSYPRRIQQVLCNVACHAQGRQQPRVS